MFRIVAVMAVAFMLYGCSEPGPEDTLLDGCDSFSEGILDNHTWHCQLDGSDVIMIKMAKGIDHFHDVENFLQGHYEVDGGWHKMSWRMPLYDGLNDAYEKTIDKIKYEEYGK